MVCPPPETPRARRGARAEQMREARLSESLGESARVSMGGETPHTAGPSAFVLTGILDLTAGSKGVKHKASAQKNVCPWQRLSKNDQGFGMLKPHVAVAQNQ